MTYTGYTAIVDKKGDTMTTTRTISTPRGEIPMPEVGMGATIYFYSDRHVGTVIAVSASGKKITVQEDHAIRTDSNGMSDDQSYRYERNPKGKIYEFTLRKNGRFVLVGETMQGGLYAKLGGRLYYYDYSF